MAKLVGPLKGRDLCVALLAACLLLFAVALVDYRTPPEMNFAAFYLLPVILVSWMAGRSLSLAFTVLTVLVIYKMQAWSGQISFSKPWYRVWYVMNHLAAFLFVPFAIGWLQKSLHRERELSATLSKSLAEVQELKGLLPVCAWCKKVRDDSGYWERIEDYIASRTKASFTHGICPDCLKKMEDDLDSAGRG